MVLLGYCLQNIAVEHSAVLTVQNCCLGLYDTGKDNLFDRKFQFFEVVIVVLLFSPMKTSLQQKHEILDTYLN